MKMALVCSKRTDPLFVQDRIQTPRPALHSQSHAGRLNTCHPSGSPSASGRSVHLLAGPTPVGRGLRLPSVLTLLPLMTVPSHRPQSLLLYPDLLSNYQPQLKTWGIFLISPLQRGDSALQYGQTSLSVGFKWSSKSLLLLVPLSARGCSSNSSGPSPWLRRVELWPCPSMICEEGQYH